jgi:signal transduction histidine kinase
MLCVGVVDDWRGEWAGHRWSFAAGPRTAAGAAAVLGVLAVAESVAHALSTPASAAAGGHAVGALSAVSTGSLVWQALVLALLGLATTVPLAFSRPPAAAVTICVACVLSLTLFRTLTVAGLAAQVIAIFRLGRAGSQLLAAGLAAPYLVLALTGSTASETRVLTVLLASLGPAAAWAGFARRARTEAVEHSADREVIAGTLLEHTARGERARISRELHDVVAHHISMIAVQAESARLTTPGMPAAGAQRLSAIGDTARAALTEMRRLLGVLREDARTGPAERQPQPGLQQLNELLDAARDASGTAARLIISGPLAVLDPGVELAAYRIVQEALTNVRRHAPGAAVDVELHYADDALRLRVRDNGPGPGMARDTPPGGHGLLGMRERAAAVGGELATGEAPGGGFLVAATLPAKAEGA